jgi:EAL and modified HD-GYP domain-containing signal transduction protein
MRSQSNIVLGRQPILDRAGRLVAYELLFRAAADQTEAVIDDNALATASVVTHAFRQIGIQTVVGGCRAFVNVDAETLLSGLVETLPQRQVVLEILESVEVDERILRRCRALKDKGYRFALDDFVGYSETYEPLLDIVDVVKIDVLQLDSVTLSALVQRLKLRPVRLLAEKVESRERARLCLAIGIDLFQGYLYGRPAVLAA